MLLGRNRPDEAARAVEEAIRLDPEDAANVVLLAQAHAARERWRDSLAAADRALTLDAGHIGAAQARAVALRMLGRRAEADAALAGAAARDPEDAGTHEQLGWSALHRGDPKAALGHFREALRLDPTADGAREGVVTALKAGNPVYGLFLRYAVWLLRLPPRARWLVLIGAFVVYRVLRGVARANPDLQPWILPFLLLYGAFVLLTWVADPLFDLLLRLHPVGRLALTRDQHRASTAFAALALLALAAVAVRVVTGWDGALVAALGLLALVIPATSLFACDPGRPRRLMTVYTLVMAAGLVASVGLLAARDAGAGGGIAWAIAAGVVLLGAVGAPWVANAATAARSRR